MTGGRCECSVTSQEGFDIWRNKSKAELATHRVFLKTRREFDVWNQFEILRFGENRGSTSESEVKVFPL